MNSLWTNWFNSYPALSSKTTLCSVYWLCFSLKLGERRCRSISQAVKSRYDKVEEGKLAGQAVCVRYAYVSILTYSTNGPLSCIKRPVHFYHAP